MVDTQNYKEKAKQARLKVLEMIHRAQSSHIGSNFSVIDILTVFFDKIDLVNDKVILSAGWKAASFYYFLAEKGFFPKKELKRFCMPGEETYIGLVEPKVPGIIFAGGSVGMGIAAGVGYAIAKKQLNQSGKVFVIESDGGMQVGMTYESALIASAQKLDNLVVICDNNKLQAMGKTADILNIEPLDKRFQALGWNVLRIDGHNFLQIEAAIESVMTDKPLLIVADTIKGQGVSYMAGDNLWHYWHIDKEHYKQAKKELCQK